MCRKLECHLSDQLIDRCLGFVGSESAGCLLTLELSTPVAVNGYQRVGIVTDC